MSAQSRILVNHNSDSNMITIICTQDVEEVITRPFRELCLIEFLKATRTLEDSISEDGELYKNCVVIKFSVETDLVEPFFEMAKTALRQSISKSINHIEN